MIQTVSRESSLLEVRQRSLAIWYIRLSALIFIGAIPFAYIHAPLAAPRNWQYLLTAVFILLAFRYKFGLHNRDNFVLPKREFIFLLSCSFIAITGADLLRFFAFRVNAYDFSIFDQMLYFTRHGQFMYSTVRDCNHFAFYPNYWLILLVPLHAVFSSPLFLVVLHGLVAFSGVFPLLKLARVYLKNDFLIALVIISYLTNAWMGRILRYSFHPEVFYIPLGLYFLYGWKKGKTWLWASALLGFLLVKTTAPFYMMGFAVAEFIFVKRKRIPALVVLFASLAFLVLNLAVVQPYFGHSVDRYNVIAEFWGKYGRSVPEAIIGMMKQPWLVIKDILTSRWYIFFGAFLFIPFLSRSNLFALLPGILILGTSSSIYMRHYYLYYSAPLIAFIYAGFLEGWRILKNRKLGTTILLAALFLSQLLGGGYLRFKRPDVNKLKILSQIKTDFRDHRHRVYAQSSLLPHLPYKWEAWPLEPHCFQKKNALIITNSRLNAFPFSHKEIRRFSRVHADKIYKEYADGFMVYLTKSNNLP